MLLHGETREKRQEFIAVLLRASVVGQLAMGFVYQEFLFVVGDRVSWSRWKRVLARLPFELSWPLEPRACVEKCWSLSLTKRDGVSGGVWWIGYS